MNFLEELVAEWYEYKGWFVRRRVKFGKRAEGGYKGEMDIVAYNAQKWFAHIETSSDALSWEDRKRRFQRKFKDAAEFYGSLFPFEKEKIIKVAIVGFNQPGIQPNFDDQNVPADPLSSIRVTPIPGLMQVIAQELRTKDPIRAAVPENYPLLRAIQFALFYGNQKRNKKLEKWLEHNPYP